MSHPLASFGSPRRNPRRAPLWYLPLAVISAVAAGAGTAYAPATQPLVLGLVALGVAVLWFADLRTTRVLLILLVGTTFVTRFRIEIGGRNFLPEHAIVTVAVLALFAAPRVRPLSHVVSMRPMVLLGLFVVWASLVSLVSSPEPVGSLAIAGWLTLDWLLLVAVVAAVPRAVDLERVGLACAAAAAAVAILLYAASMVGLLDFGTQRESITGAPALYGLAYEANILAGVMATWVFIALTSSDAQTRRLRQFVMVAGLAALLLAFTRAALLGLVAGAIVWAVLGDRLSKRRALRGVAAAFALVLIATAIVPSVTTPLYDKLAAASPLSSGTGAVRVRSSALAVEDLSGGGWVLGLGLNSFGQRHLDFTRPGTDTPGYLGNLPLQIVYETGVVGALLIFGALASLRPLDRRHRGRALGLLTLYACTAVATSPFWFGASWLLIALAALSQIDAREGSGDARPS